jgi:hypothetical protein
VRSSSQMLVFTPADRYHPTTIPLITTPNEIMFDDGKGYVVVYNSIQVIDVAASALA